MRESPTINRAGGIFNPRNERKKGLGGGYAEYTGGRKRREENGVSRSGNSPRPKMSFRSSVIREGWISYESYDIIFVIRCFFPLPSRLSLPLLNKSFGEK